MSTLRIAVGGENLIDFVQSSTEGETLAFDANPGGSPFNVAVALGRQGADTTYISPISTDELGDSLVERLVASNVKIGAKRVPEPTSRAIITLDAGIPNYEFHRDGTAERCVTTESLMENLGTDTKVLHFGGLSIAAGSDANAWAEVAKLAYDQDIFVSFDPNIRAALNEEREVFMARFNRILSSVSLVKLSDEDLEWLYPDLTQAKALEVLFETSSAPLVVLTKGPDGAMAVTKSIHCEVPAPKVENLVDTVGAGDTFMATLIASMTENNWMTSSVIGALSKDELVKLLQRGAHAAAINCARSGCNPPNRAEIEAALTGA